MLVFAGLPFGRSEVIYDNSSKFLGQFFDERTEYGDQVDLEGTSRRLTQILLEYFARFTPTGDERVKVRVYANEKPYDLYRKAPTTLLYESDLLPIQAGYNTLVVSGLDIDLPLQTATVTAEFSGIAEDEVAGLLFYGPPTIGYSFNEIWFRGATGLWVPVLYSTDDPMKRASVGMRLIADPEPLPDQISGDADLQVPMREGTNRVRFAQTFSPEVSGRLSHVVLSMQFTNQPVRVRILDTIGNAPGPNVLGTINMLNGTGTPQTGFFIDHGIYLKGGSLYAIELSTAAGESAAPDYLLPVSRDAYSKGHLWFRNEAGGLWTPVTENSDNRTFLDAQFEAHVIRAEPSVQLIHPQSRRTFDLNEPIRLEGRHRPPEIGAIARMRFFDGSQEIGVVTNAPYALLWNNATPGEHSLRAIAEDTFRRPFRSEFVTIFVRSAGPPENDNFAQRLPISGLVLQSTKPATAATAEPGEPRPAENYSGKTLWWSWTAYNRTPVTISAQNSAITDTSVAVFRGDALANLVFITNGIAAVRFIPEAGVTYAIALEPRTNADFVSLDIAVADVRVQRVSPSVPHAGERTVVTLTGSTLRSVTNVQLFAGTRLLANINGAPQTFGVQFSTNGSQSLVVVATDARGIQTTSTPFSVVVRPANDSLSGAVPVTGFRSTARFSSVAATTEALDPVRFEGDTRSVWYAWKAPADGIATVTTPNRQGATALGAFVVRTNGTVFLESAAAASGSSVGAIEFYARGGTTYHLLIAADHEETGMLSVSLRPANDAFQHRGEPTGYSAERTFHLAGGGLEPNEPAIPNLTFTNLSSAWWSWIAPASGTAHIETSSPTGRVALTVFSGTNLNSLSVVSQNEGAATLEAEVTEGKTYHIRLIGPDDQVAALRLNISLHGLRLVRPVNHQLFIDPALVPIEPAFIGPTPTREVEILLNGTVMTNLQAVEDNFVWTNPPAGSHELRARSKSAPALTSAPVIIVVSTNRPTFENKIFAGPFSRSSFVLGESGEIFTFGAGPGGIGESGKNVFQPVVLSHASGHPWRSFESSYGDSHLGLDDEGALFRVADDEMTRLDGTNWAQFVAGPEGYTGMGTDGEIYLSGTGHIQRPPEVTRWTDLGASLRALVALGDDSEVYLIRHDGSFTRPVQRPQGVTGWTRVEAGARSALLRALDGEIYSLNLEDPFSSSPPALVLRTKPSGVGGWSDFAAGGNHQLFLDNRGVLYASGRNYEGQLGIGRLTSSEIMVRVPFPKGVSRWTQIAAGEFHSLAVGDDCRVYAWGSNAEGQLGLGRHITTQNTATLIEALDSFCPAPPRISRFQALASGDVAIQFDTLLNRGSFVEYSDDLITWLRAADETPGDAQETNWIDSGPPLTVRHPRESAARFYRVVRE
jgi:hypothetical protein